MGNAINFDNYVDLVLQSNDDYEPYGMATIPAIASEHQDYTPSELALYADEADRWLNGY